LNKDPERFDFFFLFLLRDLPAVCLGITSLTTIGGKGNAGIGGFDIIVKQRDEVVVVGGVEDEGTSTSPGEGTGSSTDDSGIVAKHPGEEEDTPGRPVRVEDELEGDELDEDELDEDELDEDELGKDELDETGAG
jgi:hypothetical protein